MLQFTNDPRWDYTLCRCVNNVEDGDYCVYCNLCFDSAHYGCDWPTKEDVIAYINEEGIYYEPSI